jgi:hypothetical protein
MTAALDIDTHVHALRHYSATELIAADVDVRTVAGHLRHGGGGAHKGDPAQWPGPSRGNEPVLTPMYA